MIIELEDRSLRALTLRLSQVQIQFGFSLPTASGSPRAILLKSIALDLLASIIKLALKAGILQL